MNNNSVYLIDDTYIKSKSAIMNNVEPGFFKEYILISQNIQLQSVLGEELYELIITQYQDYLIALKSNPSANIDTYVESRLQTLVDDYIKIILLYYTLYHSIYTLQIKYTNKGAEEQNSKYSHNTDQKSIENQRSQWQNYAEHYISVLIEFLEDNSTTYSEYECSENSDRNNFTGLYLGGEI